MMSKNFNAIYEEILIMQGFFLFLLQVIPLGFEPKTHSLEGCCSVQLSYGTKIAPLIAPTKILNFSVLPLSLPVSRAYPCS